MPDLVSPVATKDMSSSTADHLGALALLVVYTQSCVTTNRATIKLKRSFIKNEY